MATVIKLRSRLLRSGCSHTSPNSTSSRSCPSLGMNSYTVGFFCAICRSPWLIHLQSFAAADWHRERERRAMSDLTRHPDLAAMQLDELPRQGQPQSGTFDLLVGRPDLSKLLEHCLLILRGDSDTRIPHRHFNAPVNRHRPDIDPPGLRRELDRVGQQVEQDLADLPLVGLDVPESFVELRV